MPLSPARGSWEEESIIEFVLRPYSLTCKFQHPRLSQFRSSASKGRQLVTTHFYDENFSYIRSFHASHRRTYFQDDVVRITSLDV